MCTRFRQLERRSFFGCLADLDGRVLCSNTVIPRRKSNIPPGSWLSRTIVLDMMTAGQSFWKLFASTRCRTFCLPFLVASLYSSQTISASSFDTDPHCFPHVHRAWLTRDRFLGLFSLLFLALHSNGTAAALAPPPFLCQVGRNTARMTSSSPGGGNSSLLLLHCPLAPTFSDQLKQARPDSRVDAQWRPNTVLLEPATLLPVTLSLLDGAETDGSVNGLPTSADGKVAQSSFTLKPLASLVRQPRFQLAACVGPINTTVSRADWVEFVEYHVGVIGVEHLFVYMPAGEKNVLHDYEREKTVTVVPWEAFEVPGGNESRARDWRSLARNQCLWHTRGLAHWTLFLDGPTAHVQVSARNGEVLSAKGLTVELRLTSSCKRNGLTVELKAEEIGD